MSLLVVAAAALLAGLWLDTWRRLVAARQRAQEAEARCVWHERLAARGRR